jgi:hypothetical protein
LAEDFAPLDTLAPNMASRLVRWLADGSDAQVLPELAALKQAAHKLRLRVAAPATSAGPDSARSRFFQSAPAFPPQFYLRLGKVYQAASSPFRSRMARAFGDPALDWLQLLLTEATQLTLDAWPRRCRPCPILTADLIEAMLEADGQPRDSLVRAAFLPPDSAQTPFGLEMEPVWETIPGLGASAGRHPAAVLEALSQSQAGQQLRALKLICQSNAPAAPFIGKLFELAHARAKRVREQAGLMLAAAWSDAAPHLRDKAARGRSGERACAARILWRVEGERARGFLAARVPSKRCRKVARALNELLVPRATSALCADPKPGPNKSPVPRRAVSPEDSARSLTAEIKKWQRTNSQ